MSRYIGPSSVPFCMGICDRLLFVYRYRMCCAIILYKGQYISHELTGIVSRFDFYSFIYLFIDLPLYYYFKIIILIKSYYKWPLRIW